MNEGVVILAGGAQDIEQLLHYNNAPAKKRSGSRADPPDHYVTADGQLIPNGTEQPPTRRPVEYHPPHCFFTSANGITIPARHFIDIFKKKSPDSAWDEKMPSWRSPNSDSAKYRRRQLPGPTSLRKMG